MGALLVGAASTTIACAALPRASGLYATSVSYEVALDRRELTVEPGGAVGFTTDLGHRVTLERGWLVQAQTQLVDCLGVGGDVWDDWRVALRDVLAPSRAYAGHGEALDPSTVTAPLAIDLVGDEGSRSFGTATFTETRYCRYHVLVAGVVDGSLVERAPGDVDLAGLSLYLEGQVELADGSVAPLVVASTLSDGAITDLPDALIGGLEGTHATVRVERAVARMLDGIDLADPALSSDDVARAALAHLDHDAAVTLRVD